MQQINLYQEQFRHRRDFLDARHLALVLVVGLVLLAADSTYLDWSAGRAAARADTVAATRTAVQQRLQKTQAQLRQAQARAGSDQRLASLHAELDAKQQLLDYLQRGPLTASTGFSPFLRGLARQHVPGVWLDTIEVDAGGEHLRLEGHALAPRRVPQLIAALGDQPAYSGHTFRTLSIDRPKDHDHRVDFVLASKAADKAQGDGHRRGSRQ